MNDVVLNRRAGRETELRKKLKATLDRYESVFGCPLTTSVLKEFLDECEKQNRMVFLRDRIGMLSDQDVAYLRNVLKENVSNAATKSVVADKEDDIDSIEEIEEDMASFG